MTASPNASRFASVQPPLSVVRRVLHEDAHHVLARRRHARIDQGRNDDVHVRVFARTRRTWRRRTRAPGSRRSALIEIAPRRAFASSGDRVARVPQKRELRQRVEREVHLARRAAEPEIARSSSTSSSGRSLRLDELEERAPRVESGYHDRRANLVAVREHHAGRAAVPDDHAFDVRVRADLRAEARAAALAIDSLIAPVPPFWKAPGAERAVDLAHVVMQQHVRRARRARAEERADDAARGLGRLERVELVPLVEVVGAAHRHELEQRMEASRRLTTRKCLPSFSRPRRSRRRERGGVGRHHPEDGLHRHRHVVHQPAELAIAASASRGEWRAISRRVSSASAHAGEVVAVVERRDRALERQDLQAVSRADRDRG